MSFYTKSLAAVAVLSLAAFAAAPAKALTMQECSAKYKQAKDAGTLNGQKWNDFRKAQCGSDATAAAPAAAPAAPAAEAKPAKETKSATKEAAPAAAPAPIATGNAVFPTAVDPKYASEKPHMARMHTCADQWKANKAGNTTGGMEWNKKGGGYYSECNRRLKGAS